MYKKELKMLKTLLYIDLGLIITSLAVAIVFAAVFTDPTVSQIKIIDTCTKTYQAGLIALGGMLAGLINSSGKCKLAS